MIPPYKVQSFSFIGVLQNSTIANTFKVQPVNCVIWSSLTAFTDKILHCVTSLDKQEKKAFLHFPKRLKVQKVQLLCRVIVCSMLLILLKIEKP